MHNEFGIKHYKGKWPCTAKTLYSEKTLIGRLQQYFLIYFETFFCSDSRYLISADIIYTEPHTTVPTIWMDTALWESCSAYLSGMGIKYLIFPFLLVIVCGRKKESKLELAASMIRQVMPEFHSKDHVIIPCDSWYTKQNLVSIVDEYPNPDLIGNARSASVMYDLTYVHLFVCKISENILVKW